MRIRTRHVNLKKKRSIDLEVLEKHTLVDILEIDITVAVVSNI